MNTRLIAGLLAAVAATSALPAVAQVMPRQENQAARIDQGVRSGQVTPGEARHLEHQQGRIANTEARMRNRHGGALTARNHVKLARMQNHANRSIYRAKHNGRVD